MHKSELPLRAQRVAATYSLVMALVIMLALMLAPTPTSAHEPNLSQTFKTCMDRTTGATFEMRNCIAQETERQDKRLNTAFQALIKSWTPKRQAQLRDAQRKWIAYRDAASALNIGSSGGGTIEGLQEADCHLTMTEQRAGELEALTAE
jgi:uncharacterized protein YecT (DUF1311 family)